MPRRDRKPGRAQSGFTLLELAVVVVCIGLLAGIFLDRVLPLMAKAERVAVLRAESDLRAALNLEAARLIAAGERDRLGRLAGSNPMAFMLEPPATYAGELEAPDPAGFPGGTWYYDALRERLVYRVDRARGFRSELEGAPRIEYAVRLAWADGDGDGRFRPGADDFHGVRLVASPGYRWDPSQGVE